MRSHYSLASISSDRTAASLSPRYKYAYLQEMIGDILATRTVFERWMKCYPNEQAWLTYIKFEQRCGRTDAARKLYERMIQQIPEASVALSRSSHLGLCQVREVGGASGQ